MQVCDLDQALSPVMYNKWGPTEDRHSATGGKKAMNAQVTRDSVLGHQLRDAYRYDGD